MTYDDEFAFCGTNCKFPAFGPPNEAENGVSDSVSDIDILTNPVPLEIDAVMFAPISLNVAVGA